MTMVMLERRLPNYKVPAVLDIANIWNEEPPLTDDELLQLAEADDPTNGYVTLSELWEEHLSQS